MVRHSHCATFDVAKEQAACLRSFKIRGERGPTKRNYYGRVTIRKQNDRRDLSTAQETAATTKDGQAGD